MANKKISQLTDGTSFQAGDEAVVNRSGTNYKVDPTVGVVQQTDIGTDPNQVPLNQYLGSMAYQDLDAVSITGGTATLDELTVVKDGDNPATLNRLTSDGAIVELQKDGTTVGSIGSAFDVVYLANSSNFGIRCDDQGNGELLPTDSSGSGADASADLGRPSVRWKDLYLSGGVYLGGTGAANLLDDYELGTFSLATALKGTTTDPSYTLSRDECQYVKVGDLITLWFDVFVNSLASEGSGNLYISLPFTAANVGGGGEYYGTVGYSVGFDTEPYAYFVDNSSAQLYLTERNGTILTTAALSSTTRFRFNVTYRTA